MLFAEIQYFSGQLFSFAVSQAEEGVVGPGCATVEAAVVVGVSP